MIIRYLRKLFKLPYSQKRDLNKSEEAQMLSKSEIDEIKSCSVELKFNKEEIASNYYEITSCKEEIVGASDSIKKNKLSDINNEDEILELVNAFEQKTLPIDDWTHFVHLNVAVYYLRKYGLETAHQILKQNIIAYNESVGIANTAESGYHETITLFWLKWLHFHRFEHNKGYFFLMKFCNSLHILDKNFMLNYYSLEVVKSPLARQIWVEPDKMEIFISWDSTIDVMMNYTEKKKRNEVINHQRKILVNYKQELEKQQLIDNQSLK